jgi:hypothetical protein
LQVDRTNDRSCKLIFWSQLWILNYSALPLRVRSEALNSEARQIDLRPWDGRGEHAAVSNSLLVTEEKAHPNVIQYGFETQKSATKLLFSDKLRISKISSDGKNAPSDENSNSSTLRLGLPGATEPITLQACTRTSSTNRSRSLSFMHFFYNFFLIR